MSTPACLVIGASTTASSSPERIASPGNLQGRSVQELRLEIEEIKKQANRRNIWVVVAAATCFVAGVALMATGLALGCLPLALSPTSLIIMVRLIPKIAGFQHIHKEAYKALESQDYLQFIENHQIPLNCKTLIKSYRCFVDQQNLKNSINEYRSAHPEQLPSDLRNFVTQNNLWLPSGNQFQLQALMQSEQKIKKEIEELKSPSFVPAESSELTYFLH